MCFSMDQSSSSGEEDEDNNETSVAPPNGDYLPAPQQPKFAEAVETSEASEPPVLRGIKMLASRLLSR